MCQSESFGVPPVPEQIVCELAVSVPLREIDSNPECVTDVFQYTVPVRQSLILCLP